jgi:hypothetical protein
MEESVGMSKAWVSQDVFMGDTTGSSQIMAFLL